MKGRCVTEMRFNLNQRRVRTLATCPDSQLCLQSYSRLPEMGIHGWDSSVFTQQHAGVVSMKAAALSEPDKEASVGLFMDLIGCETRLIVYLVVRNVI